MLRLTILVICLVCGLVACSSSSGGIGAGNGFNADSFEAELAALKLPAGVDPVLWEHLKDELRDAVTTRSGSGQTSAVPISEFETVQDLRISALNDDGSIELFWSYRNDGDYNQDKIVSAMDLTPLGIYYGVSEGDELWLQARVADGNHDGVVGVGDITMLGYHYGQRVEGYRVENSLDGEFDEVLFEVSYIDELSFLRVFACTVDAPQEGAALNVRPYDGDDLGRASNQVEFFDPNPELTVMVPEDMFGGVDARWTAEWVGGNAPYRLIWEFDGGAKDLGMEMAYSPNIRTFEMLNESRTDPASYHYTVTVEDRDGFSDVVEGEYTVGKNSHPLVTVTVPEGMKGGESATWQVDWVGGTAPYTFSVDSMAGYLPWSESDVTGNSIELERLCFNPSHSEDRVYDYSFTVTDAEGHSGSAVGQYIVAPAYIISVEVTIPAEMSGGETAVWTAQISGGNPPYRYLWNFNGGGEHENNYDQIWERSQDLDVPMINYSTEDEATYTYELTVVDQYFAEAVSQGEYTVGPGANIPPVVDWACFSCIDQQMRIAVTDLNVGDEVSISVSEPEGFTVDTLSQTVPGGASQEAIFTWTIADPIPGSTGISEIEITDAFGGVVSTEVQMMMPIPDTLYAVPTQVTVGVNEPVHIQAVTGETADPLFALPTVCILTYPEMQLVPDSFNPGVCSGSTSDVDGIWARMDPPMSSFGSHGLYEEGDTGGGISCYEIFLAPYYGGDLVGEFGELFNFRISFDTPGVYDIRFVEAYGGINRTYFEDWDEYTYNWADRSNVHEGLVTSITVE